jgi:hypothetical protein
VDAGERADRAFGCGYACADPADPGARRPQWGDRAPGGREVRCGRVAGAGAGVAGAGGDGSGA